jgi:hypothetical protein
VTNQRAEGRGSAATGHVPPRRRCTAALAGLALLTLALGAGSARAASPVEGVWSFNAGKIAIQAEPGGSFSGTVVAPTKFSQCTHPIGEEVWREMRSQPDGSYWGRHQWYFATDECIPNPSLGLTAWRVLQPSNRAHFLRVCFSEPGSSAQPTIGAGGVVANATFGCTDSALISALPTVSQRDFDRYVRLPESEGCKARRKLKIRIRDPKNDPFTEVVVKLHSGKVQRTAKLHRHGAITVARLDLRGLSKPSFTVTLKLTTALGEHLRRKHTYKLCPGKRHRHRRA